MDAMNMGGDMGAGRRLMSAVLAAPRLLCRDLWTVAADPLPPIVWPRWRARLPRLLVVIYAALLFGFFHGRGIPSVVLAGAQAATLIVAMFRPVLAWWMVTTLMVIGTFIVGEPYPWSGTVIAATASVLFLLALRVRPRVVAGALTIGVLAGLASSGFEVRTRSPGAGWAVAVFYTDVVQVVVVFAAAAMIGAGQRARRVARSQLARQQDVTAAERALRARLEERTRIARELHDVVAHHLSLISIQTQVAPHLVTDPPEELRQNLASIRSNAVEALTELRRVLGVLRLDDTSSPHALHVPQPTLDQVNELVDKVHRAGLAVTSETTGEPRPLPPGVELSAFRIVQEALSNAMRHAPGATVRVTIAYHRASLAIRVSNTAPTRLAPSSPGAGHGLLGMRERVAMLGGRLATEPTPGGGYDVTAVLPTPTPADDPAEDNP